MAALVAISPGAQAGAGADLLAEPRNGPQETTPPRSPHLYAASATGEVDETALGRANASHAANAPSRPPAPRCNTTANRSNTGRPDSPTWNGWPVAPVDGRCTVKTSTMA